MFDEYSGYPKSGRTVHWHNRSAYRRNPMVTERILEKVRGRMMEDIVLLETMKAAGQNCRVFKLQFAAGEFDMVVYDTEENCCDIYEIKHSEKAIPNQYRHLTDEEKCRQTERRFGNIRGRYVLYRGEDAEIEAGVIYQNVENDLKSLSEGISVSNVIDEQPVIPTM